MPLRAIPTAHGAAALDALATVVGELKRGDRLLPVTIVVPTNTAGVMARRALGRRGGIAAVDALTLHRVAELLASRSLVEAGRRPVSTPVVDLAVGQVLAAEPGSYDEVAAHPSTVVAMRTLYREARLAGPTARRALASCERGREPARVIGAVDRLLGDDWYDEGELLSEAAAAVSTRLPQRFAHIVVYLPQRMRRLEVELLRALGVDADVAVIAGVTGDADADRGTAQLLTDLDLWSELDLSSWRDGDAAVNQPRRAEVVSTTDADDEVRVAVRAVVDAARAGSPFDRIAVLWPSDRPYARLVEHQLTAAGLPWNGRPGTVPAERLVPRVLADLFDLDRRGLRRTELMQLLADAPARGADGRPVPTAQWDRIGRRAAILRAEDWDTRLPRWIDDARGRGSTLVGAAEQLVAFVDELRVALGDPADRRPWSHWARWAHDRIDRWFGYSALERLDGAERAAWELTQQVLDRLASLDTIGGPVTRADVQAMFVAELDVAPARAGRIGDGVHVGALGGATGLDVDLAVLLGGADGVLPPPPAIDPLLGDADRAGAGLVTTDDRAAALHHQFRAITGTTTDVVVTVPRGDLRATSVHHPSRWVASLLDAGVAHARTVDSHAQGLTITEFPVSPAEHRARQLWTTLRAGEDARNQRIVTGDAILSRALRLRDARASDRFTEYDGDLSARRPVALHRPTSPTSIEAWCSCPHGYFVRHVLGVQPLDEPDDLLTVSSLDRGRAMHDAIDRMQRAVLDGRLKAPGVGGWTDEHADELARLAGDVADELEAAGRTGRNAYWVTARAALLAELSTWIEHDRAGWDGRRLHSSEASFGDETAVTIPTADGRLISFRGQIDRIDELRDGVIVVTDHKTGSDRSYRGVVPEDPTVGGTRFQLAVYAAAARVILGRPDAVVRAEYAFFARAKFARVGITFDPAAWEQVGARLADVVDGIEGGVFPPTPGPPVWRPRLYVDCEYCEPDRLGTAPRWAEWERKRRDPRLARWFTDAEEAG